MSHEIDMSNDRANFAFTGSRDKIWHKLGQELTPGASIEEWKREAGMDWIACESPVIFEVEKIFTTEESVYKGKKIIYRGDTYAGLSIVGEDFKIVQPETVLEFFRDLVSDHGMTLSSAGCLFGGARFWALAETHNQTEVVDGDNIVSYLLFVTALDGTLSTIVKQVSERVVCNNTLTVALNETGKKFFKQTHRTSVNMEKIKIDMGLVNSSWENFVGKLTRYSEKAMTDSEVHNFFNEVLFDPKKETLDSKNANHWGKERRIDDLMNLYNNGSGAYLCNGTAWGALNAVTNMYTHGTPKQNADNRFWNGYVTNDNIKFKAMSILDNICA